MNSVKKNKTSFDEKIHSLKLDVTKRRLVWLLIPVVIILVGIILVSTIGFNLGIDFTGGTVINVIPNEINISDDNNYNQVKADIEEVLNEFGLKSTQFQIVENDQGTPLSMIKLFQHFMKSLEWISQMISMQTLFKHLTELAQHQAVNFCLKHSLQSCLQLFSF